MCEVKQVGIKGKVDELRLVGIKDEVIYQTRDLLASCRFSKREKDFLRVLLTADEYSLSQVEFLVRAEMERVID